MCEAIRTYVRYDIPNEKGETRRERNAKFNAEAPALIVPTEYNYLWEWYFDLSDSIRRVHDGVCEPVPPTEFEAWRSLSRLIVLPSEYAILRAMDRAFCAETNAELSAYRDRQREAAEVAAKSRKGKRK